MHHAYKKQILDDCVALGMPRHVAEQRIAAAAPTPASTNALAVIRQDAAKRTAAGGR